MAPGMGLPGAASRLEKLANDSADAERKMSLSAYRSRPWSNAPQTNVLIDPTSGPMVACGQRKPQSRSVRGRA